MVLESGFRPTQKYQIWVVGTVTFSAKRSLYPHAVDAVGTQWGYAVGVQYAVSTQ